MSTTVTGSKRHLNINADEFAGDLNGTINTATTATTQSTSDNSTKVATTAFVKAQGYGTSNLALGTTSTTALAGNTSLLQLGTTSTTALAGNTSLLQLGTTSTTALAGDTPLLTIGTTSTTAMAGDTVIPAAVTDFVSAANGGTFSGDLTITHDDGLFVKSTTNGGGAQIKFSDHSTSNAYTQIGHIKYYHADGSSYGSANSFVIGSTEASMTILADGKLMYNEGIYSKPSSGTGAGTRKDSNWDTAYTHSQATHAPTNADNTAANETSHADVLVDSDFGSAGFMKTDGAGTYSIDTSTYITSQATDFVSAANGGTFAGNVSLGTNSLTAGSISLPAADDITFTNTTNQQYKLQSTETRINAMPFSSDFHDVLAFGKNYTITQEISTDGSSFSSMTLEPDVFDLRTDNTVRVIDGSLATEEQAVRYTFTNVAYVSAQFLKICFTYTSPAPDVVVTVETSNDGFSSNSTQRHQSTYTGASATTGYFLLAGHGGDTHMRVTIDKGNNTDNKSLFVSSIQLLTRRNGDQGQGGEYMMPFDWNYDRDITLAKDLTVTGNLNVNGTTTTIDTTNLNVEDNNITLNYSTGDSSASAANAGITIQDAVDASNDATMLWDATNDRFTFSHAIVANGVALTGDQTLPPDLTVDGAGTVHANNYTDTQYSTVSTSADGLAPQLPSSHGGKFLRGDGTYVVPSYTTETYTQHENISAATSVNGSGRQYIQDITVDSNGHVTGISTATETVVNTDTNKFLSSITKPANSNALQFTVTNGSNLSFTFGSNAYNSTTIPTGNAAIDWSVSGEEAVIHSSYYTNTVYTHPQYVTTNIDTSGSTIVDSITTNSTGHITAMGTRTLTLGDLGFTGNSAADCVLSSTQNLGNKTLSSCTIDFDSNTISNIEVGNFKASSLVLEAEGISSNDNDTSIPTSAAVKDYVDSAVIADTDTQDLSLSGNTISLDRGGSVDISSATAVAANSLKTSFPGFGTSSTTALRGDTSIPSISGLATETYVDTAETDAIAAAATAAASLYVPSSGTTTISGTKTITGSLILDDGTGASPTMRFMNEDDDEVSIFCNPTGKMKFQQKLVGGSNVVQMTMDENGLDVVNGIKINGTSVLPAVDEDAFTSNSPTLVPTQQSVKAYVDNAVSSAGGGTMSNFTIRDDGGNDHQIDQGEFIQFDGVNCTFNRTTNPTTNNTSNPVVMTVTVPKGIDENDFLICGNDVADNDFIRINGSVVEGRTAAQVLSDIGAQASGSYAAALGADDNYVTDAEKVVIGNTTGTNSGDVCTTNHTTAGYLTSIADNSIGTAQLAHQGAGQMISFNSTGEPVIVSNGAAGTVLTGNTNGAPSFATLTIPNDSVGLDQLATGTAGEIISYGASGNPHHVAVGTSGHVLTSNGTGNAPTFQAVSGGGSYSLPTASTSTLGGVKLGDDLAITQGFNTATTGASGRTYPVQINGSGEMAVSVPWTTNTNTTYSAGDGIGLSGTTFSVSGGTGLTTDTNGLSLSTGDESNLGGFKTRYAYGSTPAANSVTYTASRTYGITKNGSDQLVVNVPWTSSGGQPASNVTSVSTLYNGSLHVGNASSAMHLDFSSASATGSIYGYTDTVIKFEWTYEGVFRSAGTQTLNYQSWSDKRLKENVQDLDYGLDSIMKLKPVSFDWKDKYALLGKKQDIGFIAQDVEKVMPKLVTQSEGSAIFEDEDGVPTKSVDYVKMVAVLTKAVQEQQKQIDELKKLINGNS